MNLEKWAAIVTIIGLPLLLLSLGFAFILDEKTSNQLAEIKQVAESQNNIALNTMVFNDPTNIGIIATIENKQPILTSHGGRFSTTQLDKYLGDFDTVYFAYNEKLLTEDELCDSFSTYIQETQSYQEVAAYLKENPTYFDGLAALSPIVRQSEDPYCK